MHRGEEVPVVYLNTIGTDVILCITAKRFGCAAVVDEHGILKGAITDGDLRRHIHEDFKKIYAADLMTTNPVTSDKEALAGYAISIMNNKGITSLFIVDDQNKPIGIVHMHDLLKAGVV